MSDKNIKTYWRNYIGGKWVDGKKGRRIAVENPATGEPLAEIACAEVEDVDRAVEAARKAFRSRALREWKYYWDHYALCPYIQPQADYRENSTTGKVSRFPSRSSF